MLTLGDMARSLGCRIPENAHLPVSGVSIDSRTVSGNMVFVALKGEHVDGHRFVKEALKKEAAAAIVAKNALLSLSPEDEKRIFRVENPLAALQKAAADYRRRFSMPVIGITGTNGKTTTKEMTAAVLSAGYRVAKTEGNQNNHIGVPLNILSWKKDDDVAVMEMGANHFGEIRDLCAVLKPTHGVITNIGKGHLEFFKDEAGVLRAKAELLEALAPSGKAFLNGDDALLISKKNEVPSTVTFGFSDNCDVRAVLLSPEGARLPAMRINNVEIALTMPGRFNLYNALAALAVGMDLDVSLDTMSRKLAGFQPVGKRMVCVRKYGIMMMDDTYNANPTSMGHALRTLAEERDCRRRVAVLGDMLELGKSGHEAHQEIGRMVVELGLDGFFGYGKGMRAAAEKALSMGGRSVYHFESKQELVRKLNTWIRDGDAILVKGSRGMGMEDVVASLEKNVISLQDGPEDNG